MNELIDCCCLSNSIIELELVAFPAWNVMLLGVAHVMLTYCT